MKPNVSGEEWDGLFFDDLSTSDASVVQYCIITGATYGIRTDGITENDDLTIDYCTIKDCDYGLYLQDSPGISVFKTNISNCSAAGIVLRNADPELNLVSVTDSRYGLYMTAASSPTHGELCQFTYNWNEGIYATGGSNGIFYARAGASGGTNKIHDNEANGVYCEERSYPNFGYDENHQGLNSILHQNVPGTYYEINNSNGSGRIDAQYNYWGGEPEPEWFYGTVDYSNWLEEEPDQINPDPNNKGNAGQIATEDPITLFYLAVDNQQWSQAALILEDLMSSATTVAEEEQVISLMGSLYRWSGDLEEGCTVLSEVQQTVEAADFATLAMMWLESYSGDNQAALARANSLLNQPSASLEACALALMEKGFVLKYDLGQPAAGDAVFEDFLEEYPAHPQAFLVRSELGQEPFGIGGRGGSAAISIVPGQYGLSPAFPNPFNPNSTIRYQLAEAALVHLNVFDITGRFVATLMNGWQPAGFHQAIFDASKVASGIYICHLQAGNFTAARKMVLMK